MIGHSRDHVRLILKVHALLFHSGVRGLNVGHGKVQDRTGMIKLRPLWTRQHQTHPSAVEKGELRPGNIKKKMGKTSLTPTLPARSSASCRRRVRMKSECDRRLSPMLVPKRSF